jgi:predicted outer membrane repeat protein
MLSFLFVFSRQSELSRISVMAQLNNISFKAVKLIQMPFIKHPIFTFSRTSGISAFSLLSTSFKRVSANIIYSNRGNINIRNCKFSNSFSPVYFSAQQNGEDKHPQNSMQQRDYKDRLRSIGQNITFLQCSFHALSSFPGASSDKNGGAVFCRSVFINFTDCLFAGNRASAGGACYFHNSSVYFQDCNFSLNKATSDGGAICSENTNMTMKNCNFVKNQADISAGAITCKNNVLSGENSLFQENTALSKSGAIDADKSKIHFESVHFTENKCRFKSSGVVINLKKSSIELYICMINSKTKKPRSPISCEDNESTIHTKGTCFDVSREQIKKNLSDEQFQESSTNEYNETCPIRTVQVQQPFDVISFNVDAGSQLFTKEFASTIASVLIMAAIIAGFMLTKTPNSKQEYTKAQLA